MIPDKDFRYELIRRGYQLCPVMKQAIRDAVLHHDHLKDHLPRLPPSVHPSDRETFAGVHVSPKANAVDSILKAKRPIPDYQSLSLDDIALFRVGFDHAFIAERMDDRYKKHFKYLHENTDADRQSLGKFYKDQKRSAKRTKRQPQPGDIRPPRDEKRRQVCALVQSSPVMVNDLLRQNLESFFRAFRKLTSDHALINNAACMYWLMHNIGQSSPAKSDFCRLVKAQRYDEAVILIEREIKHAALTNL